MKRNVNMLLTVAVVASVLGVAKAETMEERKQRIMRKYMRERQDIVQADLGVPESAPEKTDFRVTESEKFKEPSLEFKRQESGVAPPPIARPMPVQSEQRWWLETAGMEEEPYADPFSSKSESRAVEKDRWSPWKNRDDEIVYGQQEENEQNAIYSISRYDSFIYGDAAGRQRSRSRENVYPRRRPTYDGQGDAGYEYSLPGLPSDGYTTRRSSFSRDSETMPGYYRRQPVGIYGTDTGWILDSGGRYGPSPSAGLPQSAFKPYSDALGVSPQGQATGYRPYKSPFQVQDDQQRRSGGNLQPQQTPYMRPNNYQQWKDNNKTWDPTSGNIYLDELMRDQRR